MYIFISDLIPRSVNAEKKKMYSRKIIASFQKYNHKPHPYKNEKLYGFIYYFHKNRTALDADNISKPIWDALNGEAYSDDNQIVFRSAGIIDLLNTEIDEIDVTSLPDDIFKDILDMFDTKQHILYVEIGPYDQALLKLGFDSERKI